MPDKDTARQTIRESWRTIIPTMTAPARDKVNGETSWICPLCGHGKSGDGLTRNPQSKDGNGLKCFGCGFAGDIIDLYEQTSGADYPTALFTLSAVIGITIDGDTTKTPQNSVVERHTEAEKGEGNITTLPEKEAQEAHSSAVKQGKIDFTEYFTLCQQNIKDPVAVAYLNGRGISLTTAQAQGLGYDREADPANAPGAMPGEYKPHPCPRIIAPCGKSYYVARRIDGIDTMKAPNPKGSTPSLFNQAALYAQEAQEVFITEGLFDALSLLEIGRTALALNSTSNAGKLITELKNRKPRATLVLCLDNDEAGRRATAEIEKACKSLELRYTTADITGGKKDPNEALCADKESFIDAVEQAEIRAIKPDNTTSYIDLEMHQDTARLKGCIPTGFDFLDAEMGGGLYAGLYVLAAVSGLGKTTFALQLADQLAGLRMEHGKLKALDEKNPAHDVLFFSLEQSRLELVSKSLIRTIALTYEGKPEPSFMPSSLDIRYGKESGDITAAKQLYKTAVKDRISIIEGNFNNDISYIRRYINAYITSTKQRPIVIIDYLQILQPAKETKWHSTKEAVDSVVTELKRISRDYSIPVIAISSLNREYYKQPIGFEALKESGGIEYTADCVWGLQLYCLETGEYSANNAENKQKIINAEKDNKPRRLTLKCLKNRNGPLYQTHFLYYAERDQYIQADSKKMDDMAPVAGSLPTGKKIRG